MSGAANISIGPTPLRDLARDLRMFINLDVARNDTVEHFIAGCNPEKIDVAALKAALADCRKATERLTEIYHLLRSLDGFDDVVRAIAARAATFPKTALAPSQPEETCNGIR